MPSARQATFSFTKGDTAAGDNALYNVTAANHEAGGKALAERFAQARPQNVTPKAYATMFADLLRDAKQDHSLLTIQTAKDGTVTIFIDKLPANMREKTLVGQLSVPEGKQVELKRIQIKINSGKNIQITDAHAYAIDSGAQLVTGASMSHGLSLTISKRENGEINLDTGIASPANFTGGAHPELSKLLTQTQQMAKALWPDSPALRVQSLDPHSSDKTWYFPENGKWKVGLPPGASREAYDKWASTAPIDAKPEIPYLAMGPPNNLSAFVTKVSRKLKADVTSSDPSVQKVTDLEAAGKFQSQIVAPHKSDLPAQMKALAHDYSGNRTMLMDLTDFDLEKFRNYTKGNRAFDDATGLELNTILHDQEIFYHVRFFRDGKELSYEQILQTFEQDNPSLFH